MTSAVDNLNRTYRDYFLAHPGAIQQDREALDQFLVDHLCTFRGEAMPTLLKPNFISGDQARILKHSVEVMSGALSRFINLYLTDDRVQEIMGFSAMEDSLFRIDPGYSNPLVISRLDAFLENSSIKFLEFNCDSPAGIAYADVLEDGFRERFKNYPFIQDYRIEYARRQEILLDSLLHSYGEFRASRKGFPETPVLAIVDWEDVSTYSEFILHQKHFKTRGIETVIAAPADFTVRDGKVFVHDQEVHLVYKRVITRELISRYSECETFVEAIRAGLVCCCNSFRSFIVGNKKILAVITDPRFSSIFTEPELRLIRETIPWTRVLADTVETYEGEKVPLRSFIPENKDKLVLKPSNKYGGKDVYIGLETPQSTWEEILEKRMDQRTWVVQDYVDIPTDHYPEFKESVEFKSKYVNINPFSLNGKFCGTITRVSDNQVINVSAGGGLVPTLTVTRD